ncbi:Orn/Lys/Arg family decarboxylase [Zongyangia hominis]|uniref:DegT/DnrJ/EryC1/StrS family aminotransferase n=1 Tax=Zongyangia hominis TaxID=2763677 RepID=A0A926ICG1_9FIRM|nr:DegT/DnrJ/EryC1/StrS family aminotransferase [Zongyangia hominis]MBC8571323.1 DegT/DnrJ/EryC1/StrS family aminotransferase [Zongyangia hominis]
MTTPIRRMLDAYLAEGKARMHMPGHKGILPPPLGDAAAYDITEVQGADSLFECDGVIRACEEGFAALYGAKESLLSCGGSTLCIQAMLALAAHPGEKILFFRNIHRAALNAMILLDIRPVWIYPEGDAEGFGRAEPYQVREMLEAHPDIRGVYLTSPDYYGGMHDIAAIAKICHAFDVPLLVDNAHGAHLRFLERDRHPISLGADLCCDSLHKTLPALTGSAILHIGADRFSRDAAKEAMGLFGSTSPSYLMMLSMDMLLSDPARLTEEIRRTVGQCERVRALLRYRGYAVLDGDPMKLTFRRPGRTGLETAALLREAGIEPEFADGKWVVLMPSMNTPDEDFIRLTRHLAVGQDAPAAAGGCRALGSVCNDVAVPASEVSSREQAPFQTAAAGGCRAPGSVCSEAAVPASEVSSQEQAPFQTAAAGGCRAPGSVCSEAAEPTSEVSLQEQAPFQTAAAGGCRACGSVCSEAAVPASEVSLREQAPFQTAAAGGCRAPGSICGEAAVPTSGMLERGESASLATEPPHGMAADTVRPPREAYFAPSEHIHTVDAEGRIYADIRWPCPPAIPIILPGERIDKKVCEIFLASGKTVIKVVQ